MEFVIEKGVPIKENTNGYGRKPKIENMAPSDIAEKISNMDIGDSFVIGKEWRARIYMACWKNRPLTVKISSISDNNIRVWRTHPTIAT